jgi:predicted nucleotidyltransferase
MSDPGPATMGDPVLAEIVRRLVTGLRPERIYLFGSRARGQDTEDSDYDILVVVREPDRPLQALEEEARDLLWGLGVPADVIVWPQPDFDRRLGVVASLPATVVREGKLVHAA